MQSNRSTTVEATTGSYVRDISEGLSARTLPLRLWTHEAHLAAALFVVMARPGLDPCQVMPGLIRRYNETKGVANTERSGFHATITQVYVHAIAAFVACLPRNITLDGAFEFLLTTPIADRDFPCSYYSRDLLASVDARKEFVEPDLQPLPMLCCTPFCRAADDHHHNESGRHQGQ